MKNTKTSLGAHNARTPLRTIAMRYREYRQTLEKKDL